ncbi:DUF1345 domain-containing protein [Nonomuraea sp. SBT364]|uniref:DUF1345 domain-containing protein n=1 Tax=Nonomuraea sp. SBT364 TaxID=1580530 RepID=UPI00069D0915|nr:DUF1345 domain-containing protein [Nonomuraea sp. SBT364]
MTRPTWVSQLLGVSVRRIALTAAVAGLVVAALSAAVVALPYVPLIGWDVAAAVFLTVTWTRIGRLDGAATAAHVDQEDPTRAGADVAVVVAAVASLAAVGYMIVQAETGSAVAPHVGLGVASVVASWAVVHTIFTLRYALMFYAGGGEGVNFHQSDPGSGPRFTDFAYLAFTVGMTFQVSDSELRTSAFRSAVLRQALLSYLFGTVIVALAINLIAGLAR